MLCAVEAFEIYINAADVSAYISELENAIVYAAKDRKRFYNWDYGFVGFEPGEKRMIIEKLRAAHYDVKDHFLNRQLVIRW